MKRVIFLVSLLLLCCIPHVMGQGRFTTSQKRVSPTEIDVVFTGDIDFGWHVYSTNIGSGGPTPASFEIDSKDGIQPLGALKPGAGAVQMYDPVFGMNVSMFEGRCSFTQRLKITKKAYSMKAYLRYGICNRNSCLPPQTVEVAVSGNDGPEAPTASAEADAAAAEAKAAASVQSQPGDTLAAALAADSTQAEALSAAQSSDSAWYAPITEELKAYGEATNTSGRSLLYILLMGMLGGLIALATPCVWPIIPMTVSFFLHRSENRRKAISDAILYGVAIVVIYVGLGLIITSIFGTNALNDLSTNAVVNIFFFILLLIFAASFLGGFELTLPSSWSTKTDALANRTGGMISIFLMAATLAIVSFSCTGPIIGFLLVELSADGGSSLAPAVGMLGFAVALALPFTLFALFPAWLKKVPKSGSWMNVVKVTLGFVELAFALKFLSVADLAYGWHLLDRETFLALWIAIFMLLAAYLFGWIKFAHDDDDRHVGVCRFLIGLCSLAFSIYMIPGLWGAPCKAVSAFAPPMTTQDFNLDPVKVEAKFNDYDAGMTYARQVGKPVLIDFTGYGCVNCRKMEMAVWHDAKVRDLLNDDFVLISLYVDDKTRLAEPIEVSVGGKKRTLRTVGDRWSYLQETKFGANTQPQYVALDNEGHALNRSVSFDENVANYVDFLNTSLQRYHEKQEGNK